VIVENLNEEQLARIVNEELAKVEGHSRRWLKAINRAARMIQENQLMHWTGSSLIILSESGELYEVNEVWHTRQGLCPAYANGHPCKHRAAYRLIKRYNEISQ
jgi:hypothetical protein